jgi:hypothetical protein
LFSHLEPVIVFKPGIRMSPAVVSFSTRNVAVQVGSLRCHVVLTQGYAEEVCSDSWAFEGIGSQEDGTGQPR